MKKLLLTILLFLICSTAHAATTWYACTSGGNWSANVWTSVQADQGTCVASLGTPVAGDTAILNSSSGNITITAAAAAAVITETGYTGTLAFGTQTLTLTSTSTLLGAMTSTSGKISTTGSITLGGTPTGTFPTLNLNGALTFTSGGFTWPGNIGTSASFGGYTVTMSGNVVISGTLTLDDSSGAQMSFTGAYNLQTANLLIGSYISSGSYSFPASQTLTVTNSMQIGVISAQETVKSGTTSTSFNLNYTGTPINYSVINTIFTDTNASGSSEAIWDYYSTANSATAPTLTRDTNIYNRNNSNFGTPIVL